MAEETQFAIEVPDSLEAGAYADFVSIWHTRDAFVLDFASLVRPPEQVTDEGVTVLRSMAKVVSRVRVPPAQVFEIMKALEQQLSQWEAETGRPAPRPDE